jgi:NAD-dependent SIR2 family protein deacetylase
MSELEKFEYIHWTLAEILHEDKSVFTDEIDKALQVLEELREKVFKQHGEIK